MLSKDHAFRVQRVSLIASTYIDCDEHRAEAHPRDYSPQSAARRHAACAKKKIQMSTRLQVSLGLI